MRSHRLQGAGYIMTHALYTGRTACLSVIDVCRSCDAVTDELAAHLNYPASIRSRQGTTGVFGKCFDAANKQ